MSEWISVKDGLPEEGVKVLACTHKGNILTAHYNRGRWHVAYSVTITHWMPTPEPPKEG